MTEEAIVDSLRPGLPTYLGRILRIRRRYRRCSPTALAEQSAGECIIEANLGLIITWAACKHPIDNGSVPWHIGSDLKRPAGFGRPIHQTLFLRSGSILGRRQNGRPIRRLPHQILQPCMVLSASYWTSDGWPRGSNLEPLTSSLTERARQHRWPVPRPRR